MQPSLDIDALRALVLLADYASFTRAAEALGTSQAAISLRLKRLEARLAQRLVERSPRSVRLTAPGEALVAKARQVITAHDAALAALDEQPRRPLILGISDQTLGAHLPALLAQWRERLPHLRLEIRIGLSRDLSAQFDGGGMDAAILHHIGKTTPRGAEVILRDRLGWFAAPGFAWNAGDKLPLLALAPPCAVRSAAVKALEAARLPWFEAFTGGGVAALSAALAARLGVAVLGRRVRPAGMVELGAKQKLPALPATAILLRSRASDPALSKALREIVAAIRSGSAA